MNQNNLKLCPYCAEKIKLAAIVCKHCGRELDDYRYKSPESQQNKKVLDVLGNPGFVMVEGGNCTHHHKKAPNFEWST
jgi:hypothetical protein